jgi:hypothetical protein
MILEQQQTRERINEFLNSKWNKRAKFENQKVYRPTPNHFLAYEIYSINTNPSEYETITELNKMVKEGILQIKVSSSDWIWHIKL